MIGEYAFAGCTALSAVEGRVYISMIGDYAFENCTSLTKLTLQRKATVDDTSFSGCIYLQIEYVQYQQ